MSPPPPKSPTPGPPAFVPKDRVYAVDPTLSVHQRINTFMSKFHTDPHYQSSWECSILQHTTCLVADPVAGTSVYEVDVVPAMCNILGHLHGGAAGTILDQLTSMVLHMYAKPGFIENGTVTRTLLVTCLRPVAVGSKIRVEAELVSIGKTMGNVKGVIKSIDGKLCFTCAHDKVIASSGPPGPKL